jgi:3-mercaptopropionate dioxygenase
MLRGAEISRNYTVDLAGKLEPQGVLHLMPGQVTAVSPQIGDIHQIEAMGDQTALGDTPDISRPTPAPRAT